MAPLLQNLIGVAGITRQPKSLRQRYQMLVPVQLPGNFAVPHFGEIQIFHFVEEFAGGALPVNYVQMPVNRVSIIEVFITQQVETVTADPFCPVHNFLNLSRNPLPQECENVIN